MARAATYFLKNGASKNHSRFFNGLQTAFMKQLYEFGFHSLLLAGNIARHSGRHSVKIFRQHAEIFPGHKMLLLFLSNPKYLKSVSKWYYQSRLWTDNNRWSTKLFWSSQIAKMADEFYVDMASGGGGGDDIEMVRRFMRMNMLGRSALSTQLFHVDFSLSNCWLFFLLVLCRKAALKNMWQSW